jgi:ABC-2 type transport system permease protein
VTLYATLAVLGGPALVAFAVGAGSPATVLLALAAALPVVVFAATVGYLLALVGAAAGRRLPHVTGLKFGAYVGGMALVGLSGPLLAESVERGAVGPLERAAAIPVADYAALALIGTPAGVVTPAGAATALAVLALTAGGVAVAPRLAAHLWFTEANRTGETVAERHAEMPRTFAATPSLRVAWRYLLLARRAPRRLVHLSVFLFLLFPLTGVVVAAPDAIPAVASGSAVVFGTLLSGAAFGLNPLGDEGDALPALLVTGVGGRRLVRGRLLAGLAVGVPLAVLGALGLWLSLDLDPRAGAGLLVGVGPLSLAAGCVALGLGAAVPKFESEEIFGVETVHPSRIPLLLYVYGGLVAVPLGLALLALPPDTVDRTVHLAALAVYAVVVGALSVGGYVYAVRRVDGYEL